MKSQNHTLSLLLCLLATLSLVAPAAQAQSSWNGGSGNWSSDTSTGWNGTGVPNGVGAVANKGGTTSATITQDIVAGVTVGTISMTNNSNNSATITLTNGITLDQDGSGSGSATISNTNSNNGTSNFLTFQSGTLTLADNLLISNTGASTRTATNGGSILFASTSVIAGSGDITIDNVLNDLAGAGSIRIAGTNTFTGNVNVRSGGTTFNANSAFGGVATNVITLGAGGAGSASLLVTGAGVTLANNWVVAAGSGGTLTLGSTSTSSQNFNGTGTLNGDVNFLSGANSSGPSSLNGVISGVGNFTKTGTGYLLMNADNTYSGSTTISAGTLRLNRSLALQNSALDTTNSITGTASAGLSLTSTAQTSLTLGGLTGNKNLADIFTTGSNPGTSLAALTLNPGTGVTYTYSGVIANRAANMTLTKTGNGTQILSGSNTYTGNTTVSAGTLLINGSTSNSSSVSVAAGATLGGNGTVGGNTTIDGNLQPGNSPGILTFGSNLTLTSTANTTMEINGSAIRGTDFDGINVTSALTYDGTLSLLVGTTFGAGTYSFNLFDFASQSGSFNAINLSGSYAGSFTGAGDVWNLTTGDSTWTFTHSTGDLGLSVVPEPSTWALMALGFMVLIVLRRRRQA